MAFKIDFPTRAKHLGQLALAWTGLALAARDCPATDRWSGLREQSPFGEQVTDKAAIAAGWEFRGWVIEEGDILFNLHNPAGRRSVWVSLGEAFPGGAVKAWHPGRATVVVQQAGRERQLTLKQARVVLTGVTSHGDSPVGGTGEPDGAENAAQPRQRAEAALLSELQQRRARRELVEARGEPQPEAEG